MYNPERYWYSFYGGPTSGKLGWCFGKSTEEAVKDALANANMFGGKLSPGKYKLTLQQDVSDPVYSDHEIAISG